MNQPEDIKKFIAKKAFDKWAHNNQQVIQDIQDLITEMMMFEVKYGTRILYEFDKNQQHEGRTLGKDFVDITKLQ